MDVSIADLHVFVAAFKPPVDVVFKNGNKGTANMIYVAATSMEDALRKIRIEYPNGNLYSLSWQDYSNGVPLLQ